MSYIPETDEIIYNDEERAWVMNNPDEWSNIVSTHSNARSIGNKLISILHPPFKRSYVPYDDYKSTKRVATNIIKSCMLEDRHVRELIVEYKWNTKLQEYEIDTMYGREKGDRKNCDFHNYYAEHNPIQILDTDSNTKIRTSLYLWKKYDVIKINNCVWEKRVYC
jgi:hypothetical protein